MRLALVGDNLSSRLASKVQAVAADHKWASDEVFVSRKKVELLHPVNTYWQGVVPRRVVSYVLYFAQRCGLAIFTAAMDLL